MHIPSAVFVIATATIAAPAGASAAVICNYDEDAKTATVTMEANFDEAIIQRSEDAITVNGTACGDATVMNTDTVLVEDLGGSAVFTFVTISLSGGPFAPGFEDEAGDSDEIEFQVDHGAVQAPEGITVMGSAGGDTITVGANVGDPLPVAINLDASEVDGIDADVTTDSPNVGLRGSGGSDSLDAGGGAGTGETLTGAILQLSGGAGPDLLLGVGGSALFGDGGNDELRTIASCFMNGGPGGDLLVGAGGNDEFVGGGGDDIAVGGGGKDVLRGKGGHDQLKGRKGNDQLFGHKGNDLLVGGPGTDSCVGGPGNDRLRSCET
ncbi:MAG TPA: calcium-binding protein [Actinomycetota bacterium]|nr:calcium-binding protein [Actinomycetota bacterium]